MQDSEKTREQLIDELDELRARVGLLESVLDHSSTVVFIKDTNGRYLLVNKRYEELFGITDEEIIGKTDFDVFPADVAARFRAMDEKAIAAGRAIEEEELVPHRDGDHTYISVKFPLFDVRGELYATCGIATDISQRKATEVALASHHDELETRVAERIAELKKAQEQVAENERRYRTIFDVAGTGVISFAEDSVITLANEEWCQLTGYSIEETVGKLTWMHFFTEKSLAKMRKYHQLRTKNPSAVPRAYEAELRDRAGRVHDGVVNIQVVPGTQQRVASFQDLTELKRAQREMYRADKMAALGQIIAGVAHEINNPNNFIYFNLPILRKYIEAIAPLLEAQLEVDPELTILNMPYEVFRKDVFELLENMEHGSKRITGIVSDLKTYVRSDEEQPRAAEQVEATIERVMTLVGKQVRKMVKRFDVEIADGLPAVSMDAGKIEQVLINLLINAGQAADKEQSWVKLSARLAEEREGWIELRVEDNGAGISEDHLEQIFEPFFTSKGREQGTGLGLSISQRIVEEHGGELRVQSELGQGTCFVVSLPQARDD